MRGKSLLFLLALVWVGGRAYGGGPRFIVSTSAANAGAVMAFRIPNPQYFTDPGDLTVGVTHAQADAAVAAAAAVWTVPTSTLSLTQGGVLKEHVSSANTYFDGTTVVFPSDVLPTNYMAMPIAIVYDKDGSVTDVLKGAGASDPLSCRQNAVTESVDGFGADGTIQHAVMVINGKCFGPSHDQMMQLQYDVMRAFGRVVGLGWSQVNDNVFTGSPTPTAAQMANWPVMHPIDIVCGPYTYLCMQNPFVLRQDDLNALAMLYPVTSANITAGKVLTMQGAAAVSGTVTFPNTMGMDGVNIVLTRVHYSQAEGWESVSAVTGISYLKNLGNPVTGGPDSIDFVGGSTYLQESLFTVARIPQTSQYILYVTLQSINPLYQGEYALGPFQRPPVPMAGSVQMVQDWDAPSATPRVFSVQQKDAPMACPWEIGPYEAYPNVWDGTGWWSSTICGMGNPRWRKLSVKAGHSWTVEIQALDELSQHATGKLQPVIGVWKSTDPTGTLPTVASAGVPMNASVPGLTQLAVNADSANNTYRLTVADYYGGGRPDFLFQARVLYADSVAPATLPTAGGQVTITGMGFANGNRVLVNGVVAKVVSWSANTIVATAPSMSAAKAAGGTPVDVQVVDMTTGAATNITGAVTYPGGGTRQLVAVSQPGSLETGVQAGTAFAVKVLAVDGVTPVSGATVQFAVTSGGATLGACGLAASCTVTTNSAGVAQTTVTGTAAGAVAMRATEMSGGVSLQVSVTDADPVRSVVISTPGVYAAAGATLSLPVTLNAVQDGVAAGGLPVIWTVSQGLSLSAGSTATAYTGAAGVTVYASALAAGTTTVQGCAWTTVCATWSLVSVAASQWTPGVVSGAGQSVKYGSALQPVVLRVADRSGHALAGATVTVAQTVTAWEGPCPAQGRCAAAPVLATNQTSAVTDASGQVTVTPLQVAGVPQVVNVAVSTGTTGFLSMTLVKTP